MWFYPLWIPHGCPGSAQGKEPFWFHITKEFALIDFHLPEHFAQVFLCRESFQTNGCILKMTSSSASTIKLISILYRPALPQKFYWDFCHGWKDTNRILSKSRELLLSLLLSLAAAGPGHCWLSERLIQYKSPKRDLAGSRVFTPTLQVHHSSPLARQGCMSLITFNNWSVPENIFHHRRRSSGPRWVKQGRDWAGPLVTIVIFFSPGCFCL